MNLKEMAFSRESFDSFYPEVLPILERHNQDVEGGEFRLKIDDKVYREADRNGGLRIYTARDVSSSETGQIAGYLVFILLREPKHCRFEAWADAFYIVPEYAGLGRPLLGFAERELIGDQVEMIQHEVRPSHQEFAALLRHLGYLPVSEIFGKRVN